MTIQRIATSDFQGLNELKVQAQKDANEALPAAAKQFEGIFLQSMLKTMRMGTHFLDESSPFSSKHQETFQEMLDGQYADNIANSKGIGLAEMLAKQLKGTIPQSPATLAPPNAIAKPELRKDIPDTRNEESSGNFIDDFVKSLWPKAKEAASLMGLDPKILLAQVALETGWGKFIAKDTDGSSSNNLFNIKQGNNTEFKAVNIKTTEYIGRTPIKMNASFRKYPSIEHSFNDYVSLIKGSDRYQSALASASNPEQYLHELYKAGYATDPQYSSKILSIYHGNELNQAIERCE